MEEGKVQSSTKTSETATLKQGEKPIGVTSAHLKCRPPHYGSRYTVCKYLFYIIRWLFPQCRNWEWLHNELVLIWSPLICHNPAWLLEKDETWQTMAGQPRSPDLFHLWKAIAPGFSLLPRMQSTCLASRAWIKYMFFSSSREIWWAVSTTCPGAWGRGEGEDGVTLGHGVAPCCAYGTRRG